MSKNKIILTTITPKQKYIQLGLYNLKAYVQTYCNQLSNLSIDIEIINPDRYIFYQEDYWPYLSNHSLFKYATRLLRKNPKILGFSCFNWNMDVTLKLCRIIKKIEPNIKIVLGGPEVSFESDRLLKKEDSIDMIVRDEGEETFSDLLRSFFSQELLLDKIKGLSFRSGNKIVVNPDRDPLDLDKIPSPYLMKLINPKNNLTISIETSRGCPFNCAYCAYSIRSNHFLRFFPIEKVKKELEYLLTQNTKSLWINDDNFNIDPKRAVEILSCIKRYNKNTHISVFLNASMWKIDNNLIHLFKKTNIESIIGVQTINNKALSIIKRQNDLSKLEGNLRKFDKNRLSYVLQFIAGLPGDTYPDLKKSIDWASQFDAEQIQLFLLRVIRGTDLYNNVKLLGLKLNRRHYQYHTYIKETKEIGKNDMLKIKKFINSVELLYNMRLLRNATKFLINNYQIKFSDILEEWGKVVRIVVKDKKYLEEVQRDFIRDIILRYKINVSDNKIGQLLKKDLNTFWHNYLQSIYFSLFQLKENISSL